MEEATLSALLARAVAADPRGVAVIDRDVALDWATLADRVSSMAGVLATRGVGAGGRVALWLPNGAVYLTAIFAVARLGALAVYVNTRFGAAEVGDLLRRTRPQILVIGDAVAGVDFDAILVEADVTVDMLDAADATSRSGYTPDAASADADCLIYTTGGTTAQPKLVVHRQHSIVAAACAAAAGTGLDRPAARFLAAVPLCGTFGNNGAMAAVAGGATIVMMAAFDPVAADALIRRHRVTHSLGDDRMVARLAEAADAPHDTMRWFGVAAFGADAAPAFAAGTKAGIPLTALYGSSEVQSLFALGSVETGVVTSVYGDAQVEVIDDELRLCGPSLFDRYLDDPAATDAAFADGLFRTGDRARIEGDGFVFEGRMGDVLRLGGFLVSPLEIERFLCTQPGIGEAQVVGVDGARGAAPFAFVIGNDAFNEAATIAAARAQLARYKVPVRLVTLDAFPTSTGPNGPKISRAELRRMADAIMAAPERRTA